MLHAGAADSDLQWALVSATGLASLAQPLVSYVAVFGPATALGTDLVDLPAGLLLKGQCCIYVFDSESDQSCDSLVDEALVEVS